MTAPLNPADNRVGRYTGPARIVYQGDPSICSRYVTLGRNVLGSLRHSLALGGISEGMRATSVNGVTILAMLKGGMNQIFINASGAGAVSANLLMGGYQFYTTSPVVQWAMWTDYFTDFCPGGSVIYVPTPEFPRNPLTTTEPFTSDELGKIKVYSFPTYTLVESPPQITTDTRTRDECPSAVMPFFVSGEGGLGEIMNGPAFKAKNAWQINGIPEPVYYSIKDDAPKNTRQGRILNAHQQPGGMVFSFSIHSPTGGSLVCDAGFDMAPQKVKTRMRGQMPDSDWPERACLTYVGDRAFVILHTANDDFVCWPYLPADLLDPSITTNAASALREQGYKANVPSQYSKTVRPEYPSWVFSTGTKRCEKSPDPLNQILEPRVTFSYDSTGRNAVAAMVERIPISEIGPATFFYIEDAPVDGQAPQEVNSGIPVVLDRSKFLYSESDPKEVQYDRLGIVGLHFDVTVTGDNLEDFDFSISINIDESPDDLYTYNAGALIAVGYARHTVSNPLTENIKIPNSTRTAFVTDPPDKDELVTAFMTLYQHEDQKKYDLGRMTKLLTRPSKNKISFYKGLEDFKTADNPILELPLRQQHGSGYTSEGSPTPAHDFVEHSYDAFINRYLAPGDPRPPRYLYYCKLTNLNIETLSFYYTGTITKKTIDTESYLLEDPGHPCYKNFNEQARVCNVYIFGKIAEEKAVGDESLTRQLIAWMDNAPGNFPEDGEEMIPTTYKYTENAFMYYEEDVEYDHKPILWWMRGFCGICVKDVVDGFISTWHPMLVALLTSLDSDFTYDQIPLKPPSPDKVFNPYQPFPLSITTPVTEESVKPLLDYIVNEYAEFMAGTKTYPIKFKTDTRWYGSVTVTCVTPPCGYTFYEFSTKTEEFSYFDYISYAYQNNPIQDIRLCEDGEKSCYHDNPGKRFTQITRVDKCRGQINPFKLAQPDFDADQFIEKVAWFFAKYVNLMLENQENNTHYRPYELLHTPSVQQFYNPDWFNLPRSFVHIRDRKFAYIKNYDFGVDLYNVERSLVFDIEGNTNIYGEIMTTPDGHYSYYYRDLYVMGEKWANVATQCFTNETRYMADADTRVGNDEGLTENSFQWKMVEGIGWYYGLIKTTHLDMYNMAFSEEWRNAKREEKRNPPYALYSEIPSGITQKYSNADFSPEFRFGLSSSPLRGEPLYAPRRSAYDGEFGSLQVELDFNPLISQHNFPGSYYFDNREHRKHLRLSPLFF